MDETFKVDFLGLGPPKAGTTWIGHMLEHHPEICMAEPKEVHFFNDSLSFNRLFDHTHFSLGITWYQRFFKHCGIGKIKGEITPRYIIDPIVPQRIYEHNPGIKLIVCLRSPFQQIISHYHSARDYHHHESRPISQAIREEPEYIECCLYFKNVSRFLQYFPQEQIFFVNLDEVKIDPIRVVRDLYSFLQVDPDFIPPQMNRKSNPARRTKSEGIMKGVWKIQRKMTVLGFSPLIRVLKSIGVGQFINQLNSAPVEITSLTIEDKKYIKSKIEGDFIQLGNLLNKDYSAWLHLE